eukprot:gene50986-62353_t
MRIRPVPPGAFRPKPAPMMGILRLLALVVMLSGCASYIRLDPPPGAETEAIPVLGIPNARFWMDASPEPLVREGQMMAARELAANQGRPLGPQHFLALSGGGDNGAFGAGLML